MSTLVIEGGHRLHGRLDVEGNKNAALPLIAACLLTEQTCVLSQRAAHRGRRGDVPAAARSRRRGRRHRHDDAAHPLQGGDEGRARSRAGRTASRLGAADGAAPGASRPRDDRAAGRRLPDAPQHPHASRRAAAHGRAYRRGMPGTRWRRRTVSQPASYYLEEASVTGTETALLAAAAAPGRTQIRHAACEPHVVELCEFLREHGGRRRGRRESDDHRGRLRASCAARSERSGATTSRPGSWAVVGGHHRRHHRDRRHAAWKTWKSSAPC